MTAPVAVAASVTSDLDEVGWAFHPDGDRWRDAGFGTWAEAAPWIRAGFEPEQAKVWEKHRIGSDEAERWVNAEMSPGDRYRWISQQVTDPDEANRWVGEGFDPQLAGIAVRHGFGPEEAAQWWDALAWFDEFDDRDDMYEMARRWADMGLSPKEAAERFANRPLD